MKCQSLVRRQECLDQLNPKEKQKQAAETGCLVGVRKRYYNTTNTWRLKIKKESPWLVHLWYAQKRCCDKKHLYFRLGLKCVLSWEDIKFLWFRDNAKDMKKPSIDRIDGNKGYYKDNCRFIELIDNQRRRKNNNDLKVYSLYKEGKTVDEICSIMKLSKNTVRLYIGEVRNYGRANHKPWDKE